MALKATYSKGELPEGLSEHYTEQSDGSFKIDLEGGVKTQADIDKVMKALNSERDAHSETKKSIKNLPDDFDAEKWELVKGIDPDKIGGDEELKSQVESLKGKLKAKEQEVESEKESLRNTIKRSQLRDAMVEAGVTDPILLDAAVDRALSKHRVKADQKDDSFVVTAGDLDEDVKEWAKSWASTDEGKRFVSAKNNSGGGAYNDGNGKAPETNPWADDSFNMSKQAEIYKTDPEKAKQLANQAGKTLG
ncbi:MAG TPA: hypothetical protein VFG39_03465 [Balneolaceae bacterium]|nr:hypothetical protein [Balneolaceae bacterium]